MWNNQKQQKKLFSLISNLQTYYHFKLDFQKVDQHTGGKYLIHDTKRRKDDIHVSYKHVFVCWTIKTRTLACILYNLIRHISPIKA